MRTVAATAAVGDLRSRAAKLAERWQCLNGLPCLDLSDAVPWDSLRSPTWCKTLLWELLPADVDRVIWLDADVFPVRAVAWDDAPDAPFTAVLDNESTFRSEKLSLPCVEECKGYFNAGVFLAARTTEAMFREWRGAQHAPEIGGCGDQSWANFLAHKHFGGFAELPLAWNWLTDREMPPGVIHAHLAGGGLRRLYILDAMHETGSACGY